MLQAANDIGDEDSADVFIRSFEEEVDDIDIMSLDDWTQFTLEARLISQLNYFIIALHLNSGGLTDTNKNPSVWKNGS